MLHSLDGNWTYVRRIPPWCCLKGATIPSKFQTWGYVCFLKTKKQNDKKQQTKPQTPKTLKQAKKTHHQQNKTKPQKNTTTTTKKANALLLSPPQLQASIKLFGNVVETVQEYWRKAIMSEEQKMSMVLTKNYNTDNFGTHWKKNNSKASEKFFKTKATDKLKRYLLAKVTFLLLSSLEASRLL